MKQEIHDLAREVKGTNIKIVVNDPEWQELRLWLKGKWAVKGPECIRRMRNYFEVDKENPWRVRRLLNYLTCSGFRTGAIREPLTDALREEVREAWHNLLGENATCRTGGKL